MSNPQSFVNGTPNTCIFDNQSSASNVNIDDNNVIGVLMDAY
ncbi:6931_t:CDS:1, partial [Ambispora gerdemannii]